MSIRERCRRPGFYDRLVALSWFTAAALAQATGRECRRAVVRRRSRRGSCQAATAGAISPCRRGCSSPGCCSTPGAPSSARTRWPRRGARARLPREEGCRGRRQGEQRRPTAVPRRRRRAVRPVVGRRDRLPPDHARDGPARTRGPDGAARSVPLAPPLRGVRLLDRGGDVARRAGGGDGLFREHGLHERGQRAPGALPRDHRPGERGARSRSGRSGPNPTSRTPRSCAITFTATGAPPGSRPTWPRATFARSSRSKPSPHDSQSCCARPRARSARAASSSSSGSACDGKRVSPAMSRQSPASPPASRRVQANLPEIRFIEAIGDRAQLWGVARRAAVERRRRGDRHEAFRRRRCLLDPARMIEIDRMVDQRDRPFGERCGDRRGERQGGTGTPEPGQLIPDALEDLGASRALARRPKRAAERGAVVAERLERAGKFQVSEGIPGIPLAELLPAGGGGA